MSDNGTVVAGPKNKFHLEEIEGSIYAMTEELSKSGYILAEKIRELEKRNKKLESANDDLEAENKNLKKLIAKCKCLTHAEYRDWNREQSK